MNWVLGVLSSVLASAGSWDLVSLLIRVTLIAAIGAFLCSALRKAAASARHLTAVATLAALIAFPVAKVLLPSMPLAILPAVKTSTPSVAQRPSKAWRADPSQAYVSEPNLASLSEAPAPTPAALPAAPDETLNRTLDYAILGTIAVAMALLLHVLFSFLAAAVTARQARRIDDVEWRRELQLACERLGVSRAVDLRESPSITVPVVWGFLRPVLLLPVGARGWTREQLRIVFLHEVAHVARHDAVGLLLGRIATSVFWFHPLVWKLARVARQECERSCDDLVIAAGERATDYAAHLLAIVRSMTTRRERLAGVAPALAQRSSLEDRLTSILRAGQRRGSVSRPAFFVVIGSALVLLIATTVVQVVSAKGSEDRTADSVSKCTDDATNAVQVFKVEDASPNSTQKHDEAQRRFAAGEEQFRQQEYVRAATSYLAAGALGYRRDESFYRAGCALAKAGATDDAVNALGAAVEAGHDRANLGSDSDLESLRSDPGFLALVTPNADPNPVPEPLEVSVVVPVVPPVYQVAGGSSGMWKSGMWKNKDEDKSGIDYMRAGQYERAITAFEEEFKESGNSNAMYNMACAYALRGDKRRAFDALESAIENGFDNSSHMVEDEDLQSLQGDPHFYALVRLAKDLQLFNNGRFGGMNDEEDWQKALPRFERVTREHPSVGRAWANLGYARLESGDPKGGYTAYQHALELGYQKPMMMYNMACCSSRAGDLDGAFKWLDRADAAGFEIGEHVGSDSDLDAIRDDPRYDQMLDQWDQKMAKQHREKEKTD
jgi:beta-lactamase regulating signal transducer with metallopeptidase domain/tetratricopeptide (TPR) repeat protein